VTVYRGQALVTRVVDLPATAGLAEIVVSELPERLQPGSLFAESADGVEVRSVSYRERPVEKDVRADVQALDDEIRRISDLLTGNTKQQQVLAEQRQYLDKLASFVAPTATAEMTKGVLDAKQIQGLAEYQFAQRKSIAEQELALQKEARGYQESIALNQRKRNDITGSSTKLLREAVVFINQEKPGSKLRLRYLVNGATWMPSYNIRADAEKKNASVEYQASIQQMSGEDWANVKMTLSTATPSLVANAPMLNPLTISLAARVAGPDIVATGAPMVMARQQLAEQQTKAVSERNARGNSSLAGLSPNAPGDAGGNYSFGNKPTTISNGTLQIVNSDDLVLNRLADQAQVLELVAKEGKKDETQRFNAGEGIVVTYELKNVTTLPSRNDRQLIQIKSMALKSEFYKVAVPVLTNYVYDEATLTNTGDTLLAGPVASYVGGQFMGNGEIPTVAGGQHFTVGFGIDASLRATRERTDRTESVQGGNKVVKYTYKVTVENFGAAAANVRIMDRVPTAKETEVKIAFVDAKDQPLSLDKDYLEFDRKKGMLRWDVSVPTQKNRIDAFTMEYKMEMEYDKNLAISSAGGVDIQSIEKSLHMAY
jgi:hypothetical protein